MESITTNASRQFLLPSRYHDVVNLTERAFPIPLWSFMRSLVRSPIDVCDVETGKWVYIYGLHFAITGGGW